MGQLFLQNKVVQSGGIERASDRGGRNSVVAEGVNAEWLVLGWGWMGFT